MLILSRQCRLLSFGRSSLYYEPKGESAETLALMRRVDEVFLKYPFYGAHRMALHLHRVGVRFGRRRAVRLMRLMWGKATAAVLPRRQAYTVSWSIVGLMLATLGARGRGEEDHLRVIVST